MNAIDTGHAELNQAFARGLVPDPNMPIDAWSDEFMVIPKDSGANEYGKYRTARTPHARMLMQALSANHPCKRVVAMVASQVFKTQIALNFLCSSIDQQPANFLWLMPTGKLAKRISRRIDKTLDAVPSVNLKMAKARSRDALNNQETKEFEGGALFITTAGSAANLAEVPARYLVYDEIDRSQVNVDKEGSPSAIAEARQTTFKHNKKSYYPSSPTIEGESNIESLYLQGTQREALAECVHCGHAMPLVFEELKIQADGEAYYPCPECGGLHFEADKSKMFAAGLWSEGVAGDGETESFNASQMFLPYGWTSWTDLHKLHQRAKEKKALGSDELMITFWNTRLARLWKKDAETTDAQSLRSRIDNYKLGTVPVGGCVITAAIDVQAQRVEFNAEAWGEGLEHWLIDKQVIHGDPSEPDTWKKVSALLDQRYRHASGVMMPISASFIDSGGTATQDVYYFAQSRLRRHTYPIKGASRPNRPIISSKPSLADLNWRGNVVKSGVKLWLIGTDTAKDWLAARWKKSEGAGAMHFPEDLPRRNPADTATHDFFDQLCAEFRTGGYKRGHRTTWWEKKKGTPNEDLDLCVYNLAAAHYLGLHRFSAARWQTLREALEPRPGDLFMQASAQPETPPVSASSPSDTGASSYQNKSTPRDKPNPNPAMQRPSRSQTPGRSW